MAVEHLIDKGGVVPVSGDRDVRLHDSDCDGARAALPSSQPLPVQKVCYRERSNYSKNDNSTAPLQVNQRENQAGADSNQQGTDDVNAAPPRQLDYGRLETLGISQVIPSHSGYFCPDPFQAWPDQGSA